MLIGDQGMGAAPGGSLLMIRGEGGIGIKCDGAWAAAERLE